MIIHVHSIVHNEERLLPFFLDHYRCAEKIFLYDNESNDRTVEIAEGSGAVVEPHPTGGYCRELANLHLKNNAWKLRSQQADWVVVCDADEFIFHPSLLEYLMACKSRGVTIPRPVGYDMVSEAFPISGQPIIKQVRRGKFFKNFSKPAIFDPKKIVEMNY